MTKPKGKAQSFKRARREFTKSLAAVAATPLVAKAGGTLDASAQAAQQAQPAANPFAPQAEALTEVVRRRYSQYLNDEQFEAVKRSIERSLRGGDALQKFALTNADEPAFAFSPDPPEAFAGMPEQKANASDADRETHDEQERVRGKKRPPRRN